MVTTDEIIDLFGVQFRRFLYDNFKSTEMIGEALTQTAAITKYIFELELSTGVQEGSEARIYYNYPGFNPWYSTLMFKLQFSSMDDVFAFVGLKADTTAPTTDMTQTHIGVMFEDGDTYFSTADGTNQQKVKVSGIEVIVPTDPDPTRNLLYRFMQNRFSYRPLPKVYPYFDGIRTVKPARTWSSEMTNATYSPENQDHYFVAYIKNKTGYTKVLRIKHVLYGELYAD